MSDACLNNMKKLYLSAEDYHCFEDLHKLMTTNPNMTREFANYINDHVLFSADKSGRFAKPHMNKQEFKKKIAAEGKYQYCLVRPVKLRQLFAEYCIIYKEMALDGMSIM